MSEAVRKRLDDVRHTLPDILGQVSLSTHTHTSSLPLNPLYMYVHTPLSVKLNCHTHTCLVPMITCIVHWGQVHESRGGTPAPSADD